MTITCVYSSGWGNTRLVVEEVKRLLLEWWYEMELINAHVATSEDFLSTNITVLACPTYDHGVLHTPYEKLLFKADSIDLWWRVYAVIGLWDDKYDKEYNVASADILEKFVQTHWGRLLLPAMAQTKRQCIEVCEKQVWSVFSWLDQPSKMLCSNTKRKWDWMHQKNNYLVHRKQENYMIKWPFQVLVIAKRQWSTT